MFSEDGSLNHYIDGQSETENWMKFVNCARHGDEQNLTLIQDGHQLFYQCCKDILMGEELLVWYGKCYTLSMGIPTGLNVVDVKEDMTPVNELTGKNIVCTLLSMGTLLLLSMGTLLNSLSDS